MGGCQKYYQAHIPKPPKIGVPPGALPAPTTFYRKKPSRKKRGWGRLKGNIQKKEVKKIGKRPSLKKKVPNFPKPKSNQGV